MIYCNVEDVEYINTTTFRARRYFNVMNEDVTKLLPGDILRIRPLLSAADWRAEGQTICILTIDDNGWITPVPIRMRDLGD